MYISLAGATHSCQCETTASPSATTHYSTTVTHRRPPTPPDTWGYKIQSVSDALERWVKQTGRDPKRTYIWICALCLNQHRMAVPATPKQLAAEFGPRVRAIGRIVSLIIA